MAQNVSTYIKNVGKSFGYAVGDIMKEYNPVITSIAKDTKETTEGLYSSIKSFAFSKPDMNEKSLTSTIRSTVDDSIKNVFDDLKSGNLYNKSRQKAADDALAKSIMGDIDFDFDFDDWGDSDDEDSITKEIVSSNDNSTKDIISAVDQVGYKVADALGTTTIESADYIVRSSKQDSKALYALNRRGFSQVTSALLSVNNSLSSFAQIGEPLTAHMQNSSIFFTRTTETLNRMDQTLQQIAKNTTPAPSATNGNYNLAKGTIGDILGDSFDLSSYKDMIMSNIKDYKDIFSMFTDMAKGMQDKSSGSFGKNFSLVSMGTKALIKGLMPEVFKQSMKDLNEGIKDFIGASLIKTRNKSSGNIVIDLLKDMFLPKDGFKRKINTGNYNKGQVAWDGIARKALTEVIPEYLSGIYKALSGEDKVYDYNRGKFLSRSSVKKEIEDRERDRAKYAGGDFRKDALNKVDEMKDATDEFKAQMKKEIEDYFYNAFDKGDDFWNIKNFSNYQKNKFGVSDDSIDILSKLLEEYQNTPKKRSMANKFVTDIQLERDEFGNSKRREEATGTSNEVYLENGFFDQAGREGLTDKYDHSSLFYLAGIYENTGYLADNIGYIGGKSSKINKNNRLKREKNVAKILNPKEDREKNKSDDKKSTSGEKTLFDVINEFKSDEDPSNSQSFIDQMKSMGMSDEDVEKIKSEKDKELASNKLKNQKEGWISKMSKFISKFTPKALKGKFDNAFESAAGILDRINIAMTQVIWGKDGNPDGEDGFLGYLMKSTKDSFNKFNNKIDEMFPDLRKRLNSFWDSLFGAKGEDGRRHGGKLGQFRDQTREELKNSAAWMGQTVKNFFRSGKPKKSSEDEDKYIGFGNIDNAAYGRQVTKTGIVAVSEGEMIIPSELNPFYHGSTNKREQVRKEKNAITKFYGSFAPGTASVGDKESDEKGLKESIGDYLKKKVESSKNAERDGEGKGHEFIRQGFETLGSGFAEFFERIGGNNDQKEIEKEKKSLNEKAATLLKEAGLNKGAIGAGALIGGGVSILTGAVVGPLFGAAIGGAIGLTLKSEQAQKILFGDDKGNKGLLPKQVGDFIKNQLPDVGAGTAIGAAGGLFMGSPVLGAILGGTVGFVKSSEKAQNFLFGKKDKNNERTGGVFSKNLQDKIKKAVPGISAGMITGAVIGPFGVVGNLMVGAGVGYLATSHKFHNWMFGENGQGGFVETLKNKIFDNLDIISRNMWNAFKARSRNLIKSLGEKIKGALTKKAKAAANGEGGGLIGKTLNLGNKIITGTTNKIGNFLDRKRSKIVGRNLAKGYEVYDYVEDENGKRVKKTLNAAERIARRGESDNSSFNNFDKLIASANSKEDLLKLQKDLANLRNPKMAMNRARNDAMTGLYSGLGNLNKKDASKIGKLVSSGKYDKALEMVDKLGLSPDEAAKYKETINNAKLGLEKANDVKSAKDQILKSFKDQGIDARKAGNLENMQDYINEEIKQRFSDEQVAEKKEEDYKTKISTFLESIRDNTEIIASGKTKKIDENIVSDKDVDEPSDSLDALRKALDENDSNDNEKENAVDKIKNSQSKFVTTAFGDTIKMTTNSQGDTVPDLRDSATKESLESSGAIKKSIKSIPIIGSAVGGMQGFFGSIKDKLFGSEDKPGLLGTIKNLLSGDASGPLSYLFNFIAGTKLGSVGKALKGLASKVTLKGVLTEIVGPVLFGAAILGKFDKYFKKLGYGDNDKDSDIIYNKETGEQYTKDENGNLIDSQGNIVDQTKTKVGIRGGDTKSFSEALVYNTVRNGVMGKKSVASVVLGKTAVGKKVKSATSNISNALLSDDKGVAKLARNNIIESISGRLSKLAELLRKIPQLKGAGDAIDNFTNELSNKISKKLQSESAKNIAKMTTGVLKVLNYAAILTEFSSGCEDARSTLGITQKPTIGQKICSGVIRAAKAYIPVIGSLIPDNVIVDLFCDYLAPALGIDVSELKESRQKAQEEVDAYNEEHGTDLNVQEYNKQVLKDYTWTERLNNVTKTTLNDTKTKFNSFKDSVKENGLGNTLKTSFQNDIATFKDSYQNNGGGAVGIISAVGDTLSDKLPGVFGEIVKKNSEIKAYALKGDIGSLWKVSLDDFSSDTSKGEAEVGIFSKAVGQIPLITNKMISTPIALVAKAGNGIKELLNPIIKDAKFLINLPSTVREDTEAIINSGDSHFSDFMDLSKYKKEDSGSVFNGFATGIAAINRVMTLPMMLVKKVGITIKNTFDKVTEPMKNSVSTLLNSYFDFNKYALDGDISGLINASIADNEDPANPIGGFSKFLYTTMKVASVPRTLISWVAHKIGDGVVGLIDISKSNYETMSTTIDSLKHFSEQGDISSVWKTDIKLNNPLLDPLSGIWRAGFGISKIFQLAIAAFNKFISPILDGIGKIKDKIADKGSNLIDGGKNILGKAGDWAFQKIVKPMFSTSDDSGAGSGNGFVSQYDPKYKDMKYANSTVSEKGCGPAVAAMVAEKYGKKYGMDQAIKDSSKFQNEDGTSIDYFKTALGNQGISTNYIQGANSAQQITQALANGNQVILLGKDPNNTSKDTSPFGPNNHYVVATGLDQNGNLIINDPESDAPRTYSPSILRSINMGIDTSSSASGGNYDTDVARKTWGYFTSHGYTPAATAGIMGNLYQESGMDPTRHQNNGPAAGIAQWKKFGDNGSRWGAMQKFANENGYNWSDLDPQLQYVDKEVTTDLKPYWKKTSFTDANEFKSATDPMIATEGFEKAFERAGNPMMENRKKAAEAYYKLYQDSAYTGNYSADAPSGDVTAASSSETTSTTEDSTSKGFGGILSAITTAFSKIGDIFNGSSNVESSTSSADTTDEASTSTIANTGNVVLGEVPQGKGNSAQKKIVQYAESILGKDQYSQKANLRTKVGQGYSDCSSFVQWAYKQAINVDPGSNTGAIINSPLLTTVDEGSTPNVDKLEAGDLLLFKSANPNGKTKNVGHVEIYDGNGNVIGHGGGIGPKKQSLQDYLNYRNKNGAPYIEARRYTDIAKLGGSTSNSTFSTNGSSLSAAGSGLASKALLSRKSNFNITESSTGKHFIRKSNRFNISGAGTGEVDNDVNNTLATKSKEMLNNVKTQVQNSSGISPDLVQRLIESITNVLNMIANNTAPIEQIYNLLAQYTGTKTTTEEPSNNAVVVPSDNNSSNDDMVNTNISNLVGVLGEIARG